ncbi:hypothetical protein TNCV_2247451 [Trichonephila clavipes]|nr:hypothetical protein TNCV_2247451 [Trichonephila clavipes]
MAILGHQSLPTTDLGGVDKEMASPQAGGHYTLKSSPRLTEDETFNDSDIINNLIDYGDGQEKLDSLKVDKNMQGSRFRTN